MNRKQKILVAAGVVLLLAAGWIEAALVGYSFAAGTLGGGGFVCWLYAAFSNSTERVWQKWGRRLLTGLLFLGIGAVLLIEIPIFYHARTDQGAEQADYIIVLGAAMHGDQPSVSLEDRLLAAQTYLEKHPRTIAVVTGGQGRHESLPEGAGMRNWLLARGIAPERVISEERARDTRQNIQYSLEIIRQHTEEKTVKIAVLSSEYHLYRAKELLGQYVENPLGIAAPTSLFLVKVNYFLREAFAVVKFWLVNWFGKPF